MRPNDEARLRGMMRQKPRLARLSGGDPARLVRALEASRGKNRPVETAQHDDEESDAAADTEPGGDQDGASAE